MIFTWYQNTCNRSVYIVAPAYQYANKQYRYLSIVGKPVETLTIIKKDNRFLLFSRSGDTLFENVEEKQGIWDTTCKSTGTAKFCVRRTCWFSMFEMVSCLLVLWLLRIFCSRNRIDIPFVGTWPAYRQVMFASRKMAIRAAVPACRSNQHCGRNIPNRDETCFSSFRNFRYSISYYYFKLQPLMACIFSSNIVPFGNTIQQPPKNISRFLAFKRQVSRTVGTGIYLLFLNV